MTQHTASISVAGRSLTLAGAHPTYLASIDGMRAETTCLGRLVAELPAGSHCLDVGANIGVTTLIMAAMRPDCRVTAFEPIPQNVGFLRRNIETAALTNVTVVETAVSDVVSEIIMLGNGPWSLAYSTGNVRCRTMLLDDNYADDPTIGLIKIDVEGCEPLVLGGAAKLLARQRPLVYLEFNSFTLALQRVELLSFAEQLWRDFDVLQVCREERMAPAPGEAADFLALNITAHSGWSDLVMRPKASPSAISAR